MLVCKQGSIVGLMVGVSLGSADEIGLILYDRTGLGCLITSNTVLLMELKITNEND